MAPANAGEFNSNLYFDPQTGKYMLRGTLDVITASGGALLVDGVDITTGIDDIAAVNGIAAGTAAQVGALIQVVSAWNATGGTLTKGSLVTFVGVHTNGRPKIVLADANAANLPAQGALQADIANGAAGLVIIRGLSPATLNTDAFSAIDDPVYLSETAGAVATSEEVEGDEISQVVGYVAVKSATVGQIYYNFDKLKAIGHGEIQPDAVRASELGVTAGTAIASRALVPDANIDLTGLRNLTLTGALAGVTDLTTTGNTVLGNAAGDTVKFHGTAGSGAQSAFIADIAAFTDPPSAAEMALLRTMVNGLKAMGVNHGLMAAS